MTKGCRYPPWTGDLGTLSTAALVSSARRKKKVPSSSPNQGGHLHACAQTDHAQDTRNSTATLGAQAIGSTHSPKLRHCGEHGGRRRGARASGGTGLAAARGLGRCRARAAALPQGSEQHRSCAARPAGDLPGTEATGRHLAASLARVPGGPPRRRLRLLALLRPVPALARHARAFISLLL